MASANLNEPPLYINQEGKVRLAYRMCPPLASHADKPFVVFLGGFCSNMHGSKAYALERYCQKVGLGYIRFDYRGHGESDGDFIAHGIKDWYNDAKLIMDTLIPNKVVLVGSSMGGWIAYLLARNFPEKIAGIVSIAAAADFTENSFWQNFTKNERKKIESGGVVEVPSGYDEPYRIGHALVDQGRECLILNKPLPISFLVRMLYGARDEAVSIGSTIELFKHINGDDVSLEISKTADHSFSRVEDLLKIQQKIDEIILISMK